MICNYPAASRESYKEKALCREVAGFTCGKLVPGASAKGQVPRVSFWDRPKAGHFVVSLARLTEEDSGYYWCSLLEVSSNTVLNSIKFYVAVSPGEPSRASRAPCTVFRCLSPPAFQPGSPLPPSRLLTPIAAPSWLSGSFMGSISSPPGRLPSRPQPLRSLRSFLSSPHPGPRGCPQPHLLKHPELYTPNSRNHGGPQGSICLHPTGLVSPPWDAVPTCPAQGSRPDQPPASYLSTLQAPKCHPLP